MIVTLILFVTDVLTKVVRINLKIGLKMRVILKFRQHNRCAPRVRSLVQCACQIVQNHQSIWSWSGVQWVSE